MTNIHFQKINSWFCGPGRILKSALSVCVLCYFSLIQKYNVSSQHLYRLILEFHSCRSVRLPCLPSMALSVLGKFPLLIFALDTGQLQCANSVGEVVVQEKKKSILSLSLLKILHAFVVKECQFFYFFIFMNSSMPDFYKFIINFIFYDYGAW